MPRFDETGTSEGIETPPLRWAGPAALIGAPVSSACQLAKSCGIHRRPGWR